ncbi:L,D-transpeptidase [Candidatus Collierbacteria bacterium]|nr:L,D-transpeptidase [Candidatus Collierbacteria bacterium]
MKLPELQSLIGNVEPVLELNASTKISRRAFLKWLFTESAAAMLHLEPQGDAVTSWEQYWRERKFTPAESGPIFFRETGHHLEGPILEYWKFHGLGEDIGFPRSEPTPAAGGIVYQAFERAILRFDPQTATITPEPIGEKLAPYFGIKPQYTARLINPFYYDYQGGVEVFGRPLSGVINLDKLTSLQFFTNGIIFEDWHQPAQTELLYAFQNVLWRREKAPWLLWPTVNYLWADIDAVAAQYGLDLTPAPQDNQAAVYQVDGWEDQHVEINLIRQRAKYYIGGTLVMDTLISSGSEGFETPTGEWTIHDKKITFDFKSPFGARRSYFLPQVPWTMSIVSPQHDFQEGYKLHSFYWTRQPGQPGSAGCVSFIPRKALLLYRHILIGTRVLIY